MKKVFYFILLLFFASVIKILVTEGTKQFISKEEGLSHEDSLNYYFRSLEKLSDSIRKSPIQVDEMTVLDSISVSKDSNTLNYFYTIINYNKKDLDLDLFVSALKPIIDSSVKNNPKMEINRRFNTKLVYNYFDNQGVFLTSFNADY
jgi:hypothetical protein